MAGCVAAHELVQGCLATAINLALRVGAAIETPIDVRVLAASNRPIEKAVRDGALREDLLFRLKVFPFIFRL
jgi:transcriptional regulator with GAF, ATPase, and Fis domain